jgi:hypothetical protein
MGEAKQRHLAKEAGKPWKEDVPSTPRRNWDPPVRPDPALTFPTVRTSERTRIIIGRQSKHLDLLTLLAASLGDQVSERPPLVINLTREEQQSSAASMIRRYLTKRDL